MNGAELLALRAALVLQRHTLLTYLCAVVAEQQMIEPAFLALLADIQITLAAVEAELAATGDAP